MKYFVTPEDGMNIINRYFATNENGKGYIYDILFSIRVPAAVEKNYKEAVNQVKKFNKEDYTIYTMNTL